MTTVNKSKDTLLPSPAGYGMFIAKGGTTLTTTNAKLVDFLFDNGFPPMARHFGDRYRGIPASWTVNLS